MSEADEEHLFESRVLWKWGKETMEDEAPAAYAAFGRTRLTSEKIYL